MIASVAVKHRISSDIVFDYHIQQSRNIDLFSIVEVEFSGKKTLGVVTGKKEYSNKKCKTITGQLSSGPAFTKDQIVLARDISTYFVSPFGPTLMSFLPNLPKKEIRNISQDLKYRTLNKNPHKELVVGGFDQRFQYYCQKINKTKQNLLLLPSVKQINIAKHKLKKLLPNVQIVSWHSSLSPKQKRIVWQKCLNSEELIVIGSRDSLFLPFTHLGSIFIDRPTSFSYFEDQLPRYNAFYVSRTLSRIHNSDLYVGEPIPSLLSYIAYKKGYVKLIQLKTNAKIKTFDSFNKEMKNMSVTNNIFQNLTGQKTLIVGPFKNNSRLKCLNCDHDIICKSCGGSYFNKEGCLYCKTNTAVTCPKCKSHNIKAIGFKKSEVKKLFPPRIGSKFDFADLTELENLPPIYDYVLIPYFDSQYEFPFIGYKERLVEAIFTLSQITLKSVYVFSDRYKKILTQIADGNWEKYLRSQLLERKKENLPPFTKTVKIVLKTNYQQAQDIIKKISNSLKLPEPVFIAEKKQNWTEALYIVNHKATNKLQIKLKTKTSAKVHFVIDPLDFGL